MSDQDEISIEDVIACLEWLRLEGFITLELDENDEPVIRISDQADLVEELDEVD